MLGESSTGVSAISWTAVFHTAGTQCPGGGELKERLAGVNQVASSLTVQYEGLNSDINLWLGLGGRVQLIR